MPLNLGDEKTRRSGLLDAANLFGCSLIKSMDLPERLGDWRQRRHDIGRLFGA